MGTCKAERRVTTAAPIGALTEVGHWQRPPIVTPVVVPLGHAVLWRESRCQVLVSVLPIHPNDAMSAAEQRDDCRE